MSSAILYLAIVAIWACVLVPKWLHRSHEAPADLDTPAEDETEQPEFSEPGELESWAEARPETGGFATLSEQDAEPVAYMDPVAWESPGPGQPGAATSDVSYTEEAYAAEEATYSETATYVEAAAYSETVTYSVTSSSPEHPPAEDAPDPGAGDGHREGTGHRESTPAPPHRPAVTRARVLQARRRLLTMLVTLAVVTLGAISIGLLPAWIIFPPLALIGLYLLLLREAAHIDAERAAHQAGLRAQARAVHAAHAAELARERERLAKAVPDLAPTAEVIDISALASRTEDQLYDQYTDAEIRAVGD